MRGTIRTLAVGLATLLSATALLACGKGSSCGSGSHTSHAMAASETSSAGGAAVTAAAYPIDYCVVSGEKLGSMGDPVVKTYDGREVRFCCNGCVKTFEKDQEKFTKKLDEAVIAAQKDSYPLKTCVITGEKLGEMGDPADFVYNNQLVRFCCAGCWSKFKENPDKYLKKISEASAHADAGSETPKSDATTGH